MFSFVSLATLTVCVALVPAIKLPLSHRNLPQSVSIRDYYSHTVSDPNDPFNFQLVEGSFYSTTIHINGQPFEVSLDTGSSDLWLNTTGANLTGSNNTGILGSIQYEDTTSAIGNLTTIDMRWGNYIVKNQIFINAPDSNSTVLGLRDGLLGLGPHSASTIASSVQAANASDSINSRSLVDNIFEADPDKPNYMTFLLSRSVDGVVDGGDFTLGEIVQGHDQILTSPKLPVIYETESWVTLVDGLAINGERIEGSSNGFGLLLPPGSREIEVPEGKFTAVFDTGVTETILPRSFVDAIFDDVPVVTIHGQERIMCDSKLNLSILVGKLEYPIHPLDLMTPVTVGNDGTVWCKPRINPIDSNEYGDFQFGDVILRNLYTLFNFGNWTRPGNVQPYIQITSVTDKDTAWAEFDTLQEARVRDFLAAQSNSTSSNDTNTSASDSSTKFTSSTTEPSLATDSSSKDLAAAGALSHADSAASLNGLIRNSYVIIGLLVVNILLVIGVVLLTFVRKLSPRSSNQRYKEIIPPGGEFEALSGPSGRYSD